MKPTFRSIPFFLLLFLWASAAAGKPQHIVTTTWLAERIDDPHVVLLHIGRDEEYAAGRLPGALFLSRPEISAPMAEGDLALELPSVAQLDSVFESRGISDESTVVLYWGKDWVSPTARAWLTFDYVGFGQHTFILDGGMPAWTAEGRPVSTEVRQPQRGTFTPHMRDDVVVGLKWVEDHITDPSVALIDARDRKFYDGEEAGSNMRAGHIPGAGSVPYAAVFDENLRFRPEEELRAQLLAGGLTDGRTSVSYCHIGQQASVIYFVARSLGYKARMYDGSMNEWSQHPELPLVFSPPPPNQKP